MKMVSTYIIITGILSIIGSVITAWLCYEIYKYNRLRTAWLAVVWAFIIIIIRRSIGFVRDFNLFPELNKLLINVESTLLIIISILYIIGFWSMLKNFENFEVIEKTIRNKANKFKRK